MANAAGPSIGQSETAPHQASPSSDDELGFRIPSRSQAILSLIGYEDLYSDINNHLDGDVRHRFLDIRAKRARYVEGLVIFRANTLATLEHDVRMRKVDPSTEDFVNSYDAAMEALGEALSRLSHSYSDDSQVANAPLVERHYMDHVYRHSLEMAGRGPRAPNGLMRSTYGSRGEHVSPHLMGLRDLNNDFFRRLILDNLMVPFNDYIFSRVQATINQFLGRNIEAQAPGMSGRTLEILVTTLECIAAVVCFASSVTLVYNLGTTKDRIIAAPFACFACVFPVMFLSKEARSIFGLVAGIWAVLIVVVFLSEADLNGRANSG